MFAADAIRAVSPELVDHFYRGRPFRQAPLRTSLPRLALLLFVRWDGSCALAHAAQSLPGGVRPPGAVAGTWLCQAQAVLGQAVTPAGSACHLSQSGGRHFGM